MNRASGDPDTPQRNWNNIPDHLRTMPVKLSVKMERSPSERSCAEVPRMMHFLRKIFVFTDAT